MKIVWILVILIIIGVAVFAIRKQIGDKSGNEEQESSNIAASDKEAIKSQIAPQLQKTFEEKQIDAYSGKIPPEQLQGIRSDPNLTTEEKDKVEFESVMFRFWPERIKARSNGKLRPSLVPYTEVVGGRNAGYRTYIKDRWVQKGDSASAYVTHQTNIFPTPIDALFVRDSKDMLYYPNSQFMADNQRLWEMFNAYKWVSEDLRVNVVLKDSNL